MPPAPASRLPKKSSLRRVRLPGGADLWDEAGNAPGGPWRLQYVPVDLPSLVKALEDLSAHPYFPTGAGVTLHDDRPAIRFSLGHGTPLAKLLEGRSVAPPLSPRAVCEVATWLADAIEHGWGSRGVLLRFDIRTTALRISQDGRLRFHAFETGLGSPEEDVYQLGMTVYELATRRRFGTPGRTPPVHGHHVERRLHAPEWAAWGAVTEEVQSLIRGALSFDQAARPTASTLSAAFRDLGPRAPGPDLRGWTMKLYSAPARRPGGDQGDEPTAPLVGLQAPVPVRAERRAALRSRLRVIEGGRAAEGEAIIAYDTRVLVAMVDGLREEAVDEEPLPMEESEEVDMDGEEMDGGGDFGVISRLLGSIHPATEVPEPGQVPRSAWEPVLPASPESGVSDVRDVRSVSDVSSVSDVAAAPPAAGDSTAEAAPVGDPPAAADEAAPTAATSTATPAPDGATPAPSPIEAHPVEAIPSVARARGATLTDPAGRPPPDPADVDAALAPAPVWLGHVPPREEVPRTAPEPTPPAPEEGARLPVAWLVAAGLAATLAGAWWLLGRDAETTAPAAREPAAVVSPLPPPVPAAAPAPAPAAAPAPALPAPEPGEATAPSTPAAASSVGGSAPPAPSDPPRVRSGEASAAPAAPAAPARAPSTAVAPASTPSAPSWPPPEAATPPAEPASPWSSAPPAASPAGTTSPPAATPAPSAPEPPASSPTPPATAPSPAPTEDRPWG